MFPIPTCFRRGDPNGRPRVRGERLLLLSMRLADPATHWEHVVVAGWYGEGAREIECVTGTAIWYHGEMPRVPIRWVLVRDPFGRFDW